MIAFEEMDLQLGRVGKDRAWLAEQTPYKANSIRQALAPNGSARSERMRQVLSRAIEDEAARQSASVLAEARPAILDIFQTSEQLDRADCASRLVNAASLTEFCRKAILAAADKVIRQKRSQPDLLKP